MEFVVQQSEEVKKRPLTWQDLKIGEVFLLRHSHTKEFDNAPGLTSPAFRVKISDSKYFYGSSTHIQTAPTNSTASSNWGVFEIVRVKKLIAIPEPD